ncbi:MAG: ABC transporter permease [Chthoniobacterales bacterium]|nr:ABC transporter permease [Chthoniobacterales bacterium]
MSTARRFSVSRLWAMVVKEFVQMSRDRLTFAMILGIPLMQLIVFGVVINTDPRHMPAAVLLADDGPQGRTLLQGLKNSTYFDFVQRVGSEAEGERLLRQGRVQFVVSIPENFSRDLLRGDRPSVLVEADATDPTATSGGLAALGGVLNTALLADFKGPLARLAPVPPAVDIRVHALYNPEAITHFNIVPGLMGVVLTMTLVLITGLAITRETERGTMENLLSMPLRPTEVLIGKITPYIFVGYIQVTLILVAARFLFGVPIHGNLFLLLVASFFFIAANLAMGITFSTIAKNQLQAMQMSVFVFLPSILLSGFLFPFRGMPGWAQVIGEILPITHFLRIARGVMLKGIGFADLGRELWPIALFAIVVLSIGVRRYRQTLD